MCIFLSLFFSFVPGNLVGWKIWVCTEICFISFDCDFSYFCIKMFSRLRQANKDITIWSIQVQLAMFSPRESTRGDIRRLNTEQELGQWNGNGKCCICPAGGFNVEVGLGFTWMSAWLSSMHVYLYIQTLVDRHFNNRGMIELWYIRRVNSTPYADRLRSSAVWKCLIRGCPQPYLVQSTTHLLLTPRLPKVSGSHAVLFFISATSVHENMMNGFVIVLSPFSLSKIHGFSISRETNDALALHPPKSGPRTDT